MYSYSEEIFREGLKVLSYSVSFPVFLRTASFYFRKYFGIVIRIVKPYTGSHIHDGKAAVRKIFQTSLNAVFLQKCKEGDIHVSLKKAAAFAFAKMNMS